MIFLQVTQNSFWYDHGVSLGSAIVTFLAFLLTFITLIHNSNKEKREAEIKSEKTLSVLDFIFENNNEELKVFLEEIKYIREHTNKGINHNLKQHYHESEIEEWENTRDSKMNLSFDISSKRLGILEPRTGPTIKTRFENNYIVLETYASLKRKEFTSKLDSYQDELKINLKNQHLNITSDSLEKISKKINRLKESKAIFESVRKIELIQISMREILEKTEDEISEDLGKDVLDYINEDYEKILKLERALQEVIKPLSNGEVK